MKKIKEFFGTPKKAVISSVCLIAGLVIIGAGGAFAAGSIAESSSIGAENAQNFAFADAGVDPAEAKNVFTEFDYEQGKFVYEVEFTAGGVEYDYWIKADDGTIVKKESKIFSLAEAKQDTVSTNADANTETADTTTSYITEDEAKQVALGDAALASADVTFTKVKRDRENGVEIYEIEFYTEDAEYEYEIRAVEGTVYSKSKETIVKVPQTQTSNNASGSEPSQGNASSASSGEAAQSGSQSQTVGRNYIGVDQAKAIAVEYIGASVSDVNFTKAKLDEDVRENEFEYEIEFYLGGTEYEFTIDALSGSILEYDSEQDDDHDDDWDDDD